MSTLSTGEQKEQLQQLNSAQLAYLREKFITDLYFGAKSILGYDQLEESAHGALCQFMVYEQSNRRMVLMSRGFLKSTVCTIADSIRLSCKDPNITILLQNEVFDNAALFLDEIKNHWEKGILLRSIFPELVPTKLVGAGADWSKTSASITRSSISRMSTYTASGSGGSPQSQHFKVIKNDDLIGEKARLSELEMRKAINWSDAMTPLLDRLSDQLDFYGTRKTLADVYAHQMQKYGDRLKVFVREPIENGDSIFPGKVPLEELLRIMVETPDVWAYDYMNNPLGGGSLTWGRGLLRHFHMSRDEQYVIFEDHFTGNKAFLHLSELDIVITADPNSGRKNAADKAAITVQGAGPKSQVFCLDATANRESPDEFINRLWDLCVKWKPRVVGIEDAGLMNTLYYFEKKCQQEGRYWNVRPLKPMSMKKDERILRALDTPMKSRRVYVLANQLELISQLQMFPQLSEHNWDTIDAFSYGNQLYEEGVTLVDRHEQEEAERIISESRGLTGYGRSV